MEKYEDRIVSNAAICSGKPCIKGTRIPVHIIIDLLAESETFDNIKRAYPNITNDDITACIKYAALLVNEESGVVLWNLSLTKIFLNR